MPMGRNSASSLDNRGSERPVVFQKQFKSGSRTYASQIKIASNGKRYLALTEGVRDPQTQELKKHVVRVLEDDLKEFFSMMQETVVYLRAKRDAAGEADAAAANAAKPIDEARSSRPAAPRSNAPRPVQATKPPVASHAAPAKPVARPAAKSLAKPAAAPAVKTRTSVKSAAPAKAARYAPRNGKSAR